MFAHFNWWWYSLSSEKSLPTSCWYVSNHCYWLTNAPQQSGFTRGRSTMDALALRLLAEIHRAFAKPFTVAYVDIKAAFDSMDRNARWKAMQSVSTPPFLLQLRYSAICTTAPLRGFELTVVSQHRSSRHLGFDKAAC